MKSFEVTDGLKLKVDESLYKNEIKCHYHYGIPYKVKISKELYNELVKRYGDG